MSKEAVETSLDLEFVDRCVSQIGTSQAQTLAHLQALQKEYGYLPPQALERLSEITGRQVRILECSFEGSLAAVEQVFGHLLEFGPGEF